MFNSGNFSYIQQICSGWCKEFEYVYNSTVFANDSGDYSCFSEIRGWWQICRLSSGWGKRYQHKIQLSVFLLVTLMNQVTAPVSLTSETEDKPVTPKYPQMEVGNRKQFSTFISVTTPTSLKSNRSAVDDVRSFSISALIFIVFTNTTSGDHSCISEIRYRWQICRLSGGCGKKNKHWKYFELITLMIQVTSPVSLTSDTEDKPATPKDLQIEVVHLKEFLTLFTNN